MQWQSTAPNYQLETDAIHLYWVSFSNPPFPDAQLIQLLDGTERQRAERFKFTCDKVNFILSRGLLRILLSRYLEIAPEQIDFDYSEYGKPSLKEQQNSLQLQFNLSHTKEHAIYAITQGQALGVDIETIRPDFASLEIAQRFFSPTEYQHLQQLPQDSITNAFFHTWTCKEAFIKAIGEGLSFPLNQFDVCVDPALPSRILAIHDNKVSAKNWTLQRFAINEATLGTIAIQRQNNHIIAWRW